MIEKYEFKGEEAGVSLLVLAAIHGNETAGTNAAFNKHYVSESIVNLFQPQEKPLNQSLFCRACRRLLNIVHIYHLYEFIVQDIFSIKYKKLMNMLNVTIIFKKLSQLYPVRIFMILSPYIFFNISCLT